MVTSLALIEEEILALGDCSGKLAMTYYFTKRISQLEFSELRLERKAGIWFTNKPNVSLQKINCFETFFKFVRITPTTDSTAPFYKLQK